MTYVRVGLGILLVCVAPGVLVVIVARVQLSVIETLAVVPALSLGLVFLVAEATSLVRIPFGPAAFFVMLAGLAIVAVIVRRVRGWRAFALEAPSAGYEKGRPLLSEADRTAPRFSLRTVIAISLLMLAVGAGGWSWLSGVHGGSTIPGNFDASQHGFMVARVANTDSIAADDVLVSDLETGAAATAYYPLGTHASGALVHRIAGVEVDVTLTSMMVFFAAFVFPVGLYALVRYLWPREPLAAGFAALVGVWLVIFPYKPAAWGGIPLIVGMTLVPISLVFLTRTLLTQWSVGGAALTALVLTAGFVIHNSQLPVIVLFSGLLVVERAVRTRSWRVMTDAIGRLVLVALAVVVLLAPTLSAFVQGGSDRFDVTDQAVTNLETILGPVLTLHFAVDVRQAWLALFALAGILVVVWQRRLWSWVLGCLIVVGLTLVAGTTRHGMAFLTAPWYRQAERVAYNLAFFVPVFGGIALALLVDAVSARFPGRRFAIVGCAIGGLALVSIATGLHAARATRAQVRASFTAPIQPIGQDSLVAFRYLRRHAGRSVVLNDLNIDGSLWMYAFDGVRPLFALTPTGQEQRGRDYRTRLYIHDHIHEAGSDPRLDRLMTVFQVKYVYWGRTSFLDSDHQMDLESLRTSPGLEEVLTKDSASVFRVK
jgi:hypothetical protein